VLPLHPPLASSPHSSLILVIKVELIKVAIWEKLLYAQPRRIKLLLGMLLQLHAALKTRNCNLESTLL